MAATGVASGSAALQRLTCWMMLIVLLAASWQSTAHASRLIRSPGFLKKSSRRLDSATNSERPQVFRAELMHRDHPLSQLAPAEGTTLADRWAEALQRTRSRMPASRDRRLSDFQTPVTRIPGEYAMTLSFGTPPQKFTGLVDTGSDLVWVQCVKCATSCFNFVQRDPLYDPTLSASTANISCTASTCTNFPAPNGCTLDSTCGISYGYGDGSTIQGTLLTETITLVNTTGASTPTAPGFIMGCMNNNTGIFDSFDGIVGFGRGNYSFVSQMSRISYLPVFSYCLVPITATTTDTSTMLFGASDPTNALGLVYTPILYDSQDTFYYVNMTGISVNGVALTASVIPPLLFVRNLTDGSGGVIFDSGTQFTQVVPQVYDALKLSVARSLKMTYHTATSANFDFCFSTSGLPPPVFPNVTFHFGGVDGVSVVDYDLADYNLFGEDTPGVTCLLVTSSTDTMIIGNVQMGHHYIETDETANMRIGWVTKDCTV